MTFATRISCSLFLAAAALLVTACEGPAGKAGESCTVTDNGDGTKTVACPGSSPVTIADGTDGTDGTDGADGTSCTVADNGDGTKTISCTDNTTVTVSDGRSCSVNDNGDGTKTITCPGSAPVTVSDGTSCSVIDNHDGTSILSCADGTRVVVAPPIDTNLDGWEDLPGVVLNILSVGGQSNANGSIHPGDHLGVTFTAKTTAGRIIPLHELDEAGLWFSGPNTNYQHVLPAARDAVMYTDLATASTLNDDGSYTYRLPDAVPLTFGVPLYDTTRFSDGELTGPLTAGTYTLAMVASKDYSIEGKVTPDASSVGKDLPLDSAAVAPRALVADGNCSSCHKQLKVHEGKFQSVSLCGTCHTSGAEDVGSSLQNDPTPVTIELRVMIHKLHDGSHLPSVQGLTTDPTGVRVYGTGSAYKVGDEDFSAINYPAFPNYNIAMPKDSGYSGLTSANKTKDDNVRKGVTACATCHGDPDGAGPLTAPANGDAAFAAPSRRACASCHDDLDFSKPYVSNGSTMPANATDSTCSLCHNAANLAAAHTHPLESATASPETTINVTGVAGATGAGGKFAAGDPISMLFTIKDASGNDVPITYLDSMTMDLSGPTQNRQVVVSGLPGSPLDFAGRLAAASTTNKGIMSKVDGPGPLVSETLTVSFTSATAFDVTGTVSGALGSGTLPASPGTYPSGASISNVVFGPGAIPQQLTVAFTAATTYTVTGSVSGAMGGGTLPAALSNTQRFTSTDGSISFNIVVGTTAAAAGNAFYLTVFKGAAANPVLFAIVGGRTAFAAKDRFYYDLMAPASTYTLKAPEDLYLEALGRADGTAGQRFTAANLPVRYGRQTLLERTATPGLVMTTTAAASMTGRYLYVSSLDPGVAANDYLVIDDGTANEEYVRVGAVNATLLRIDLTAGGGSTGYSSPSLRFTHSAGATVREVTLVYRQEGAANDYVLDAATGQITLNNAATAGDAFVLSYRTDARFGWKRKLGDSLVTFYGSNLVDAPELDETWGDWRGKPMVDGTYTAGLWGYHSLEYRSGGAGTYEWQSYRSVTKPATFDFLYGATATTITPYAKIDDLDKRCNACHVDLSFHGGTRRGAQTCMQCHATNGPDVSFRTLAHDFHADALPVMPNGAASCATCHGATQVFSPASRAHPTAQGKPTRDWTYACTSCHSSAAAGAHADTMTSAESGAESCLVCHGPGRDLAVDQMHKAR
ncbi:MAG TPA: hypothetical protein VHE35_05480 [Kofleriaceae bacterium]|nr:hypothetical protein [Kofleriaceae bacterium]